MIPIVRPRYDHIGRATSGFMKELELLRRSIEASIRN